MPKHLSTGYIQVYSLLACAVVVFGLAVAHVVAAPAVTIVSALGASSFSIDIARTVGRRAGRVAYLFEPAPYGPQSTTLFPAYCDYIIDTDAPLSCRYIDSAYHGGRYSQLDCSSIMYTFDEYTVML